MHGRCCIVTGVLPPQNQSYSSHWAGFHESCYHKDTVATVHHKVYNVRHVDDLQFAVVLNTGPSSQ